MKNPNIIGIIHSMIWFVCACLGSTGAVMVIFCMIHMDAPTSTGRAKFHGIGEFWTLSTRSMPTNMLFNGICAIAGFHE